MGTFLLFLFLTLQVGPSTTAHVLKTRHDTVKNSIGNIR